MIQGTQGDHPTSLSATGGHISASFQTLHGYSNDEQWNSDLDDDTESDFAEMLPHLHTSKEFTPISRQHEKRLLDEAAQGTPAAKRQPPLGDKVPATTDTKESPVNRTAIVTHIKQLRLPVPCPLPTNFTKKVTNAIQNNQVKGVLKTRLLRQAAAFYWGLCPRPTHDEYVTMAVTL